MTIDDLLELPLKDLSQLRLSLGDSIGTFVTAACLLESSAIKAGNVHPTASFRDMTYSDFRHSAQVIGEAIDRIVGSAAKPSVGYCVSEMAKATKQSVGVNTYLGTILLLAPLVLAVVRIQPTAMTKNRLPQLRDSLKQVLGNLKFEDSQAIYESIALLKPGGLGKSSAMDVNDSPPGSILDAMHYAKDRDDVAKQWATNYEDVFHLAERLCSDQVLEDRVEESDWLSSISFVQIARLAEYPDSLIRRKTSMALAKDVQKLAQAVVAQRHSQSTQNSVEYQQAWQQLDEFLRQDGHRRNPGTTADLLAAAIFVGLIVEAKLDHCD